VSRIRGKTCVRLAQPNDNTWSTTAAINTESLKQVVRRSRHAHDAPGKGAECPVNNASLKCRTSSFPFVQQYPRIN
jgi:hypothetical protein